LGILSPPTDERMRRLPVQVRREKTTNTAKEGLLFTHIMVPVDLAHLDKLERALATAGDLAKHFGARVTYVGVTSPQPGSIAHNPHEFAEKLSKFAAVQAELHNLPEIASHPITTPDPAVELDRKLEKAVHDLGVDLVVMGSHIPRRFEFGTHGGRVASHTDVSVLLVRG
jgi:nucleotide-binding universal stress UspA family protein